MACCVYWLTPQWTLDGRNLNGLTVTLLIHIETWTHPLRKLPGTDGFCWDLAVTSVPDPGNPERERFPMDAAAAVLWWPTRPNLLTVSPPISQETGGGGLGCNLTQELDENSGSLSASHASERLELRFEEVTAECWPSSLWSPRLSQWLSKWVQPQKSG